MRHWEGAQFVCVLCKSKQTDRWTVPATHSGDKRIELHDACLPIRETETVIQTSEGKREEVAKYTAVVSQSSSGQEVLVLDSPLIGLQ